MVNDYLYYGYLPPSSVSRRLIDIPGQLDSDYDYSLEGASDAFDKAIDNTLANVPARSYCVVPISGGLDSRALLGAALERFPQGKVKTMSFGAPGQLDFDIGSKIAKKYKLEHHAVDLSLHEVTWESLASSVKESPWTYVFSCYYNKLAYGRMGLSSSDVVLSGFLGDVLTGGHLNEAESRSDIIHAFAKRQRREKKTWLPQKAYDPLTALPDMPASSWNYGELLDLTVRQSHCIAPIVIPPRSWNDWGGAVGELDSGASMLAPFADPGWAKYWLMAPNEMKRGKKLYINMLKEKYPKLFAMPSKYTLGAPPDSRFRLRAAKVKRQVRHHFGKRLPKLGIRYAGGDNYLDFATAIRHRTDFQNVMQQAIGYLKTCEIVPWIDLDLIYHMHIHHQANNSNALTILVGLALNIEQYLASQAGSGSSTA